MSGMEVKDMESVRAYLMYGAYVVEVAETSMNMLSMLTLQLSQGQRLLKPAMEAFRVLAFPVEAARGDDDGEITQYHARTHQVNYEGSFRQFVICSNICNQHDE
jgi:hypothetical protein